MKIDQGSHIILVDEEYEVRNMYSQTVLTVGLYVCKLGLFIIMLSQCITMVYLTYLFDLMKWCILLLKEYDHKIR